MKATGSRFVLLLLVIGLTVAFFALGLQHHLSLQTLRAQQQALADYRDAHALLMPVLFGLIYVAFAALSLPGAIWLTLAAGALFGVIEGTLLVSFASSFGATLSFLASRFLFRDLVQRRFHTRMHVIDEGLRKDGALYLLALRLVPVFPFFLVNLVMGLTALRTRTFYIVSQIGMLPVTLLYVNAGTQLASLQSPRGLLSPTLLVSLTLLGIFPLAMRRLMHWLSARRVYRRWQRPRRFDRNLVVIGAGAAGLVTSYIAAAVRAKVTLIEQERMGGDCLNTGCVPSKTLIRASHLAVQARKAEAFGLRTGPVEIDFAALMLHVQHTIADVAPHDSVERYTELGVEVRRGHARIVSPWCVEVEGQPLTTRAIVIAAGAAPRVPPLPGLQAAGYLTSDTLWDLRELPRRLLILGGGPIGCELAQAFARLGSAVTMVQSHERLLTREDDEVSALVHQRLEADGVRVLTAHQAIEVRTQGNEYQLLCQHAGTRVEIAFDRILVAVGRQPRTHGYGLEELGIPLSTAGTIETDAHLATLYPNIYACGDVAGPYQFTHMGAHQAWYASVNALFGGLKRFRVDYRAVPAVTFVDPEVARVGLNEREARASGIPYEVTRYDIEDLDRAITEGETAGFIKVLTVPGKDRILGATIVAAHAGELLAEFTLAMRHGLGLNKILGTIHAYPTWAEANKYAAGSWKRAHAPERALHWLARFHAWRRRERVHSS